MVLGIAALLLTDLALAYKRVQYGWELARMRAGMTETERQRVDVIAASEENRLAIAVELARRQALGDTDLHLAVDTAKALLGPERQGGTAPRDARSSGPGGEVLYSRSAVGPLSDASYVLPGKVPVPPLGTTQRRYKGVLGTRRLNMGDGYGIHGTNQPQTVGRAVSHGCVRLRNEDIAKLYAMAEVGTSVYIY